MLNKINKNSGFTIVELLIVIVVIAILAAISIVAYNGIQSRAKTNSGQSAASQVIKKLAAMNAVKGSYHSSNAALTGAAINTYANASPTVDEARIDNPSSVIGATNANSGASLTSSTASNGTVVAAWGCSGGADVYYFNYDTNAPVLMTAGNGCP